MALSIAVVGPHDTRRGEIADAVRSHPGVEVHELTRYPNRHELSDLAADQKVVIIDLDSDLEHALEMVEVISCKAATTVMVYSEEASPDKLMRSMRAGAREFLTLPVAKSALSEALSRAATRAPAAKAAKRESGKLFSFMGAKGGVGVTTLACNFAIGLARQETHKTILIDLAIPLGDVALAVGVQSEYSTVNALQAAERLDTSLLDNLLVKHESGLAVLPAPGKFVQFQSPNGAVAKLLAVARQSFDYVVVDAGSRLDLMEMSLFKDATAIYLVAQVGVAELRNSNRLISQFFAAPEPKVEIILNRYDSRSNRLPEDYITKILTKTPQWKVPNDYEAVQRMQIDSTPLLPGNSPISRVIQEMVSAITGEVPPQKKKRSLSIFG
jgi:pilus assembly protein CpaE